MPDHTRHQKKIIERYYDRRDEMMLAKLQEIVTEPYLAESDTKRNHRSVSGRNFKLAGRYAALPRYLESRSASLL